MEGTNDDNYDIIFPTNIKKYTGYITERKNGTVTLVIKNKKVNLVRICKSVENAEERMKKISIQYGTVKNIIHKYPTHLKVLCAGDKYFICDHSDIDLVQEHIWWVSFERRPVTHINKKKLKFCNLKMKHTTSQKYAISHIDGDYTNNMGSNLIVTDERKRALTRNMEYLSLTGIVGVCCHTKFWKCSWVSEEGRNVTKTYSIKKFGHEGAKQKAIEQRKWAEENISHYKEAFNKN
jgi:hypothetical protein